MQQARTFGALATPVPVIGIGTWNMERDPRPAVVAAIRRALDLGATHVDTAELYGRGKVEHMVGEAIAGRRDEVFLVSKVLPGNATRAGVPKACEASLRRLGTDHLDSYLLHWWEGELPLEDTFYAFQRLVEQGKIRSWGVSNFDVDELEHALSIVGPGLIACNQVLYHLGQRAIERAVLPFCEANGITVVGYSPFGSGDFPAPDSPGGRVLDAIAAAHQATPRQVALAFLTRRPSLLAIPKSSRVMGVEENCGANRLSLNDSEIEALDTAFPADDTPGELPML